MHPPVSFIFLLLLCYLSFSQSYLTVPEDILEYENEWAVQLNDDNPEFLEKEGYTIERKVTGLKGIYIIKDKVTQDNNTRSRFAPSSHVDRRLSSLSSVVWAEQQYKTKWSKREKIEKRERETINDPMYASQWHLHNTGQFLGLSSIDVNVLNAWDNGYTGTGVRIAIVDDGYQTTHPDLAPNYKSDSSYSFNNPIGNSPDPDVTIDFHGTAAAGVAFAAPNSVCGVGAAYTAWGAGIRLISDGVSDATTAEGLTYKNQLNDIYSNSWGPPDNGIKVGGPGMVTKAALKQSVINGRGGKGSIYVWAAGNGGAVDDNCNYDGYSTAPETIAIGAIGNNGIKSFYSEPCAALLVSAPSSSSNENAGIRTSDLIGVNGYNKADSCTPSFGGTSSSCPLVAGIIALMLQANPKLGWRDVPIILAQTAVKVDEDDSDWSVNGAGHHVNHKYGFGLVDASAAVQASKKHKNVQEEKIAQSPVVTVSQVIPDFPAQGVEFKINIEENFAIEKVILSVSIDHKTSGDLQVELMSPSGTNSVMSTPHAFVSALYLGNTPYPVATASFGARVSVEGVSGPLVAASPNTACTQVTNCNDLQNSIAVVYATDCGQRFTVTAKTIQNCGAKAMIMISDEAISMSGTDPTITIVVISVGRDAVSAMVQGATATIRLAQYLVNNYANGWSFKTVRPLGESPKGTWILKITDGFKGQTGTLNSYSLTVYGAGKPKSKGSNAAVVAVSVIFSLLFVGFIAGCVYVYYRKGNLFGYTYTKGIGIHKMSQVSGYVPYVDRG